MISKGEKQMSGRKRQTSCSDEDERWDALIRRDPSADGTFVYGVTTTGVYCRPGCRSRRPNRRNVVFFDSTAAARRAGFRACRRCRPDQAAGSGHLAQILAACRQLDEGRGSSSLDALAAAAGLSRFHFLRVFKTVVGLTPKQYAEARRQGRFRRRLRSSATITDAIYEAGFNSSSRAYEGVSKTLGMTPRQYRHGGAGLRIRYAVTATYLGWMVIAATDRGICMIAFSDSREAAADALQHTFPHAEVSESPSSFAEWVERLVAFVEHPSADLRLPLDIQGTSFQQRVWRALQQIPPGRTATYAQVARRIGRPRAVRAVGRACATNNLAVVIPCHRVVGSDGKLTGYRWGVQRKRAMLDREGVAMPVNRW
jgi:AraC family transcriptional regulator, regulatory protein of adaptative response / methylated-DNA-[protein]-cysteine methyltransferase